MARASAVLGGTLTGCGLIESFLSTGKMGSFLITMATLIRPCHTHEGDRNFNPQIVVLGSIFCLLGTLSPRRRAPPALYRSSAGFPPICDLAARADFFDDELERHRACPSIKTSADEPSDVP